MVSSYNMYNVRSAACMSEGVELWLTTAGHTLPGAVEAEVLPAAHPLPLAQQQLHRHLPLLQGHLRDRQHCRRS